MIKTTAINNTSDADFLIGWDIGKRCNFDCSYCSDLRHTNDSPHSTIESLTKTYHFAKKWFKIYNNHFIQQKKEAIIDFTGGEATNNPNFWNLLEYIKNDDPSFKMSLTTNASWHQKNMKHILDYMFHVTASIHFEADPFIKNRVLNNILALHESSISLTVNVMLHTDMWDEVKKTCEFLDSHNINYNPVPIGDGPLDYTSWRPDGRGVMRRTAHTYSKEQQEWFFNKMNITTEMIEAKLGNKLGRECCGRRCLTGKVDDTWQPVKFVNTEFKDWYCMVDWYFLHIDQELGQVFHHQTCQALRNGTRGPIGYLDESDRLLSNLEKMLASGTVNPIRCTLPRCGCGMCTPKAKDFNDFKEIWHAKTNVEVQEK